MKGCKMKKTLMSLSLILIVVLALTGCYEWPDPIWNPDDSGRAVPTISSVSTTTLRGGIDNLTITGSGFGTVAEELLVRFKNGTTVGTGRVISATDTEIIVEAPAVYSDSLEIWIDLRGCFEFAKFNSSLITISSGLTALPIISSSPLNEIGINENGDIIVALGSNKNVISVTVDDSISQISNVVFASSLNVLSLRTKGNMIYYTVREMLVDYDGTSWKRHKVNDTKNNLNDFAFANNGKVYCASREYIYSTDHDLGGAVDDKNTLIGTDAVYDTTLNFTKCEVYDDKLYVAATYVGPDTLRTNEKLILSYDINTDGTLSGKTIVINWTEDFAGSIISGITFDSSDKMYVATETRTPIYVIDPVAGSYADGNITLLYPVLLKDEIISMRWDAGGYMGFIYSASDGTRTANRLEMVATASPSYIP
jgi:IPT/TIG domain-containing protein